jgi:phosphopantothenoylcysteine synthetase/decarboxylase
MKVLVTAGNTQAPIDRVRCITNIFTGRTGASIARHAHERGHTVTLLTSHPETVSDTAKEVSRWTLDAYRTFDDLHRLMAEHVQRDGLDAIVHCAAVSDYLAAGIYSPAPNTLLLADGRWGSRDAGTPTLMDCTAGKVKSDVPELWLRLVRAPKLIDFIRTNWSFRGVLVKFKLEVDVTDERLLEIAERSRRQSDADLMVANTLEGSQVWAILGPLQNGYERVSRDDLPRRLLDAVEQLERERRRG